MRSLDEWIRWIENHPDINVRLFEIFPKGARRLRLIIREESNGQSTLFETTSDSSIEELINWVEESYKKHKEILKGGCGEHG